MLLVSGLLSEIDEHDAGRRGGFRKAKHMGGNPVIVKKLSNNKAMIEGPCCPFCVKRSVLRLNQGWKEAKELRLVEQVCKSCR